MKPELYNKEFNKMFEWFTNESSTPGLLNFELEFYKKLWNLFIIGDSYYFILNHNNLQFDLLSNEVENVLGYNPSECTFEFMAGKVHPDDQPWYISFGHRIIEFFSQLPAEKLMRYKLRYDLRYKKKNGDYARILYQGVVIENDNEGRLLRSFAVHTDITYLKNEGKPVLSLIGMGGEPSFVDVGVENMFIERKEEFTRREKQILTLLIEGKLSKEIGRVLHISKQTVDTHRKNMLHKKNLSTTGELVGKSIRYGWV